MSLKRVTSNGVTRERETGKKFKGQEKKKKKSCFLCSSTDIADEKCMAAIYLILHNYCLMYPINCKVCYESPDLNRPCNRY